MGKRVFLFVSGGDYSAIHFEEDFDAQKFYEDMVKTGITEKNVETDELYIEVEIKEFGEIDDSFIGFIRDHIVDYDMSKDTNFYEVSPI